MGLIKEINKLLRQKVDFAFDALSTEEHNSLKGGCAAVAFDGILMGELPQEAFTGLFRRGGGVTVSEILGITDGIQSASKPIVDFKFHFFSSSPRPFGIENLEVAPLSHRGAEELVERIRNIECLGSLIVVGKGEEGHIASLIGDDPTIFKFDARRYPYVNKIGSRKAVRILRRAQKGGLVIEWG